MLISDYYKNKLHPDLLPYLSQGLFGIQLHHPLIIELWMHEDDWHIDRINQIYKHKQEAIKRYVEKKDWFGIIAIHERPYRLNAFINILENWSVNDKRYWRILGEIWTDSENIWQNKKTWQFLLTDNNRNLNLRSLMMSKQERSILSSLPDELIIYRGCKKHNTNGLSWTLSKDKATFFANRLKNKKQISKVIKGTCMKSDVIAYFSCRNEEEIVILYNKVSVNKDIRIVTKSELALSVGQE